MKSCFSCSSCIRFLTIVGFLGIALPAHSALIVDTGVDSLNGNLWVLNGGTKLSGQFSLAESTAIGSIKGWMGFNKDGGGFDFNIKVYSDVNGLPGQALFSQSVFAPAPTNAPIGQSYGFGWYGVSGLSWNMAAGDYWVSFEGVNPAQPDAIMPGSAVNPLMHYAFNSVVSNDLWRASDNLELSVQIESAPAIVPVPAAIWLLGSGLIGIFGLTRRKARAG